MQLASLKSSVSISFSISKEMVLIGNAFNSPGLIYWYIPSYPEFFMANKTGRKS